MIDMGFYLSFLFSALEPLFVCSSIYLIVKLKVTVHLVSAFLSLQALVANLEEAWLCLAEGSPLGGLLQLSQPAVSAALSQTCFHRTGCGRAQEGIAQL